MEPIVFYDIPGNASADKAWSPNTWKTRLSLNIKGIPYRTVWVEAPDIEALYKELGATAPTTKPDGSPYYTLPAIHDPNTGSVVSESAVIARYLDKTYPTYGPTLIPSEADALHEAFIQAFQSAFLFHALQLFVPASCAQLSLRSRAHFQDQYEKASGQGLEAFPKFGDERWGAHWVGFERALGTFRRWLEADGREKKFFMGEQISFADVTIAAWMLWIKRVSGAESREWKDIMRLDGGYWARFVQEFERYETVDVESFGDGDGRSTSV